MLVFGGVVVRVKIDFSLESELGIAVKILGEKRTKHIINQMTIK